MFEIARVRDSGSRLYIYIYIRKACSAYNTKFHKQQLNHAMTYDNHVQGKLFRHIKKTKHSETNKHNKNIANNTRQKHVKKCMQAYKTITQKVMISIPRIHKYQRCCSYFMMDILWNLNNIVISKFMFNVLNDADKVSAVLITFKPD